MMQNIETQLQELKAQIEAVSKKTAENKLAMIVFSGDMDKVLASFVIAAGGNWTLSFVEAVNFGAFVGDPSQIQQPL